MKQRKPLNPKRPRPRRDEGRVVQLRMKPVAKVSPNAIEAQHLTRVAAMGCLACGAAAIVHHVMAAPGKIRRRDHRFIAPLCPPHHNMGDGSVHLLGSEARFLEVHGIDLVAWSVEQWAITEAQGA